MCLSRFHRWLLFEEKYQVNVNKYWTRNGYSWCEKKSRRKKNEWVRHTNHYYREKYLWRSQIAYVRSKHGDAPSKYASHKETTPFFAKYPSSVSLGVLGKNIWINVGGDSILLLMYIISRKKYTIYYEEAYRMVVYIRSFNKRHGSVRSVYFSLLCATKMRGYI